MHILGIDSRSVARVRIPVGIAVFAVEEKEEFVAVLDGVGHILVSSVECVLEHVSMWSASGSILLVFAGSSVVLVGTLGVLVVVAHCEQCLLFE